jgi:exopolyphosphatase/guanosine-5'-triphosphate,3'-diphosphate pyrophosphatase
MGGATLVKVAAVDIGTNTVRLLMADVVDEASHLMLEGIERHEVITRLGEGLDATGRLAEIPIGRALAGLATYAELIDRNGATVTGGVATEATRSAENGDEFIAQAAATLGFSPRVIDGIEEADLTFRGATNAVPAGGSFCVIDVGGGSTEFVVGHSLPEYAMSIDIGSVRLTERMATMHLAEPAALRDYVDGLYASVATPYAPDMVLGSGGTFVTLGAVARNLSMEEAESRSDLTLSAADLAATVDELLAMNVAEIADLPAVPAARAGVLKAGAVCAERALARVGSDSVMISVADILDGLALRLAEESLAESVD